MKHSCALGTALTLMLFMPLAAQAQTNDTQAEIRAALAGSGGAERLSEKDLDTLVQALAKKAESAGMQAGDVALARAEALFVEHPKTASATPVSEERFEWRTIAGALALLVLLAGALWYWRRMHHGGALGH